MEWKMFVPNFYTIIFEICQFVYKIFEVVVKTASFHLQNEGKAPEKDKQLHVFHKCWSMY
jgi:hypothetical protein